MTLQLLYLYKELDSTTARPSLRTSTHVHVNVQPRTLEELRIIVGFSILAEPLLMSFAGETREENIYCVPFYRTPSEVDTIAAAVNTQTFEHLGNTCKYSGLYLAPVLRFGTIEYRHAPFWTDRITLEKWLDIITVCATAYQRFNDFEDMIAQCENDPWAFFQSQFGSQLHLMCPNAVLLEEMMDTTDIITVAERLQPCTYKAVFATSDITFGTGEHDLRQYYRQAPRVVRDDAFDPYYDEEHHDDEDYDEENW